MKKNYEESMYETENPKIIRVVETYEIDRYEPRINLKKDINYYYSDEYPDHVANKLTACCEDQFYEYFVYDNLIKDMTYDDQAKPEYLITSDYKKARIFCDKMKEKYGVNFDNAQIIY